MGCDIHGYIERKITRDDKSEHWWKVADLSLMRNYAMFGLLAGVRSGDEPLFPPRGWDKNSDTKDEYCLWVTDENPDGDNNCSKEDAARFVKYGSEIIDEHWVTHPDWHTPSWLTADEMEKVVEAYKKQYPEWQHPEWDGVVGMLKQLPDSRFIFWFDN